MGVKRRRQFYFCGSSHEPVEKEKCYGKEGGGPVDRLPAQMDGRWMYASVRIRWFTLVDGGKHCEIR